MSLHDIRASIYAMTPAPGRTSADGADAQRPANSGGSSADQDTALGEAEDHLLRQGHCAETEMLRHHLRRTDGHRAALSTC
jgi:hypothetical protein